MASLLWGLNYVAVEKVAAYMSVYTLLACELVIAFIVILLIGVAKGTLNTDIHTILTNKKLVFFILLSIISFTLGNFAIASSVAAKNATLAGIIEVSYPIFIVLFSWLILGQTHLNSSVVIGGLMIIAGVLVVYFNS